MILLESAWILLLNNLLLMLRIEPGDSFPKPLGRAEEKEYLDRWLGGDLEARNILVEHNLRLVAHIVKKYYQNDDADDLISIGSIGLIKGINTYRPDKGVRLATYASRCIENEILMAFRARRKTAGDVSLNDALDADEDGGGLRIMDVIASEDDLADQIGSKELCRRLRTELDRCLDTREARIIRMRYGLDGAEPMTQLETAQACRISRSYVSRLEKRALEKLRAAMEGPEHTG
ncbi:MAG: RNA polymerase sporulation sigma factor SigK [Oscillospiraceae bacterium]|nr:RNA polymerase sporulation sigma factor SigK [Oscillospiraceae bacterium]